MHIFVFFTSFARMGFATSNGQSLSKEPARIELCYLRLAKTKAVREARMGAALAGGVGAMNAPGARGLEVSDQSNTNVVRIEHRALVGE